MSESIPPHVRHGHWSVDYAVPYGFRANFYFGHTTLAPDKSGPVFATEALVEQWLRDQGCRPDGAYRGRWLDGEHPAD